MTGNVWQILFSDWYDFSTNRLNFALDLAFIGSPGMAPKVNWSRMCQQVYQLIVYLLYKRNILGSFSGNR